MSVPRWLPVLFLSLLSTASFAGAADDPYVEAIAAARARAQANVTRGDAPGVAVAVYADRRIVWSEGFGLSNLENQVAVTPMTRFRIGSLSKAMTAATAGKITAVVSRTVRTCRHRAVKPRGCARSSAT